jgi:hypothetical protein
MDELQPLPDREALPESDISQEQSDVGACGCDLGQVCADGKSASFNVVFDLSPNLPVSEAELDAILLLLGTDLARLLAG